jgi:alkanesulfonate monooxygenase SsuD/methylene tetrahydromethanopterin reductase-like flavin-dependent oxidoreductase (luciferase family)
VSAKSHIPGGLTCFEGKYHDHDWSTFLGAFATPVRETIPIWVAANQTGLARLAGEVADGLSTIQSTDRDTPPPTPATRWPRACAKLAGTGRRSTGTAGSGWRSTTTARRRSTMPRPRSPSTPACAST